MATWAQVEGEVLGIAAAGARLWGSLNALDRGEAISGSGPYFPIAYLATIRRDDSARVHPFCPILAGGRLFAVIPRSSPKGWDLRRNPRCSIHALPGPDDDESCIRAHARELAADSPRVHNVREVVGRSGVGGMIESVAADPLFEFDLDQVDVATWINVGQPGTSARRHRWRAGIHSS